MPRTPGSRRCVGPPSRSRRATPTSPAAAPTRPGSSARPPRRTPAAGWPARHRRHAAVLRAPRPAARGSATSPTARFYIGRISVTDDDLTPLVVDWRAPVAEPFYRATAVEPMGVARRRHFQTHGPAAHRPRRRGVRRRRRRRVRASRSWARARCSPRSTRSAPAACATSSPPSRPSRTKRSAPTSPGSSSSPAVPAPARPRSRCTAPRTSSTRTASGSASQGVLLVGPEPDLPALHRRSAAVARRGRGELATPAALKPRLGARHGDRAADVAAVKGDARMAQGDRSRDRRSRASACRATSSSSDRRLRAAPAPARLESHRRARARRAAATHNERRPYVAGLVHRPLPARVPARARSLVPADRARLDADAPSTCLPTVDGERRRSDGRRRAARGEAAPEEWEDELTDRLRRAARGARRARAHVAGPERRRAGERPVRVRRAHPLGGRRTCSPTTSSGCCSATACPTSRDVAVDRRRPPAASTKPTPCSGRRARRARVAVAAAGATRRWSMARRTVDGARRRRVHRRGRQVLERYGDDAPTGTGDDDGEPRTFGHVLVDEAQDLTAMQWRMLARRCPSGSMTLVGDFGQASRPGALAELGRRASPNLPVRVPPRRVTLTVNYRTPAEIMEVANRLLPAAAPGVEPARSVRSTGAHPGGRHRRRRRARRRRGGARRAPRCRRRAARWR